MLKFLAVYLDKKKSFTPKKYELSHGQDSFSFKQQICGWKILGKTGQSGKVFFCPGLQSWEEIKSLLSGINIPTTIIFLYHYDRNFPKNEQKTSILVA